MKVYVVIEFLTSLHDKGNRYNTICTARSALATVVFITGYNSVTDHPLVKKFIKGVFNRRPPWLDTHVHGT